MNLPTGFSRCDVSTTSMKDEVKGRNGEERAACKSTGEERKLQSTGSVLRVCSRHGRGSITARFVIFSLLPVLRTKSRALCLLGPHSYHHWAKLLTEQLFKAMKAHQILSKRVRLAENREKQSWEN